MSGICWICVLVFLLFFATLIYRCFSIFLKNISIFVIARSLSFETLKQISIAPTPKLRFRGHSPWLSAFIYAQSKKGISDWA